MTYQGYQTYHEIKLIEASTSKQTPFSERKTCDYYNKKVVYGYLLTKVKCTCSEEIIIERKKVHSLRERLGELLVKKMS